MARDPRLKSRGGAAVLATFLVTVLAAKTGWREHALRDALRGKDVPGVRRTSFGYHIEASAVDEIAKSLGAPPPKPNSPKRPAARVGNP